MKKKKRKRRSVKDPVLMMMMVNWFKKTEFQAFVNFQKKLKCLSGLKELENVLRWLSNLVLLMIRAYYLMISSEKRKLHSVVKTMR
ncbi:hypothetical protein ERO13_A12G078800v2 [Gossypium hirsutum]|uniref:Uncharacterized protein n=2 Tax=Gossypium TaxID=3633 RepID=A0A5J5T8N2_GOSBA|nr:hypothetical protein ES319_A12G092500v1 [Gossypium barbadense]KAG4169539.1 hypothetical protein ERO13_A12G078800v2 [Gossypium hirsutum]TYG89439.1 hypothetical protein ES288_A12G099900v1 [Gossypium darwinii]